MDDNGAIYLGIPDPSVEGMPADVIGMDKDEAKTAVENASNNKIEVILEPRFSAKKDFGKIVASNYIFGHYHAEFFSGEIHLLRSNF